MIVLFTDFGLSGPYTGQMKAVLAQEAPGVPVIDLFADAPAFDPQASAYLLAAYSGAFPAGAVFLAVVDPGVGGNRRPLALQVDGSFYVGPDNGLFTLVCRRAASVSARVIDWRPPRLSATFHGRDLFAPVAARLATGRTVDGTTISGESIAKPEWPDDLERVIYIDVYGNAMTGLRTPSAAGAGVWIRAGDALVPYGRTFSDVPPGAPLWYGNANGLVEIAVNGGRADTALGLRIGTPVCLGTVAEAAGRSEPDEPA